MRRLRVAGGVGVAMGGAALIVSPFLDWLGVRSGALTHSFTLSGALRAMGRQDLLGPGMSVIPIVALGSVAVILGIVGMSMASPSGLPLLVVLLGAAGGAFVAYLHAALEYTGFAMVGASIHAQTTPA
ncbi:MAG TPA: hypothetical protein VKK30_03195, partial [Actinomycetota bacterium]|nr:hypothetical protein [Actinomycetota bacterium]